MRTTGGPLTAGPIEPNGTAPAKSATIIPPPPKPYFTKSLSLEQTASLLAQVHAAAQPTRAKTLGGARVRVYTIAGGGEAMVTEVDGATLKVELFKGKCPC